MLSLPFLSSQVFHHALKLPTVQWYFIMLRERWWWCIHNYFILIFLQQYASLFMKIVQRHDMDITHLKDQYLAGNNLFCGCNLCFNWKSYRNSTSDIVWAEGENRINPVDEFWYACQQHLVWWSMFFILYNDYRQLKKSAF